ncbi:MAG: NAD(P)-binding protein [Deltaproteobacteria bacterium]|nr:NAD(P)-binding protein [Deltaproteobacteria bacterium]
MKKVIILGGGVSGLSAAWQLSRLGNYQISLHEKREHLGGLSGSYHFKDYQLDFGPHKLYSIIPGIMPAFQEVADGQLREIRKKHKIILRGKFLDYPVSIGQVLSIFSFKEILELCFSVAKALLLLPFPKKLESYEDYCRGVFGEKIYRTVFYPLAGKVWGDPGGLSADIARRRIPAKNILDLILRILKVKKDSETTDAVTFLYPRRCFGELTACLADKIRAAGQTISTNSLAQSLVIKDNKVKAVVFADGHQEECDLLLSSIPLRHLMSLVTAGGLEVAPISYPKMRNCVIAYLQVNKAKVLDDHWIFCPDKDLLFSRISEQKLLSDLGFEAHQTVLCCDFTCDPQDAIWQATDKTIADRCVQGLVGLNLISADDVLDFSVVKISEFYPTYQIGYQISKTTLFDQINKLENVICAGRLGLYEYFNVDHCFDISMFIARSLAQGVLPIKINQDLLRRTDSYRIVD